MHSLVGIALLVEHPDLVVMTRTGDREQPPTARRWADQFHLYGGWSAVFDVQFHQAPLSLRLIGDGAKSSDWSAHQSEAERH